MTSSGSMRLLYFTRTYSRHDARWLRALAGRGGRVGFLSLQENDAQQFARAHSGLECLPSPGLPTGADTSRLDAVLASLRAQVLAWTPDVILAGPLTDAGYLATRIAPERTVLMSWAFDVLHEPQVERGAEERLLFCLRTGQNLFADCHALLHACTGIAGRPFARSCVVPWGLAAEDKPVAITGWRRRLGDENARVVLNTRGFEPVHSPLTLIEAFRRAHASDATIRLWLAGDGSMRAETEKAVRAAHLDGAVRFLGQLDQPALAGCFAEADSYVACSRSDGSSLSLLQAMHAGLPCIAADLPGNREWLQDVDGRLVPVGDHTALAAAISASLGLTDECRAKIGARTRRKVSLHADLSTNLPRLFDLLAAVAAQSREVALPRIAI